MKTRRVLLLLECTNSYLDTLHASAQAMVEHGGPIEAFYTLAIDWKPEPVAAGSPHLELEQRTAEVACAFYRGFEARRLVK